MILIEVAKLGWKLEKIRRTRTTGENSQNHHLNGHIQQIVTETGQPFDDVKLAVKFRACDMGYPFKTMSTGDRIPRSEPESSVVECGLLIEAAHIIAAELGINLYEGTA